MSRFSDAVGGTGFGGDGDSGDSGGSDSGGGGEGGGGSGGGSSSGGDSTTASGGGSSSFSGGGSGGTATTYDVTDYGAAGDGTTDDTQAIRDAANAADPGETVYFPSGTYLVGSNSNYPLDYPMDGSWDNLTWEGEDWSTTTVKMDGGHSNFHMMFRSDSGGGHQTDRVTFKQLEFDMNAANNQNAGGSLWYRLYDAQGTFTMRDCIVRDTLNAGVQIEDQMDATIEFCDFVDIGDASVAAGHCINPNPDSAQTYDVYRCYFENGSGQAVNMGRDDTNNDWVTLNFDENYRSGGIGGVKMSTEAAQANIRNSHFVGDGTNTLRTIKSNSPDSADCGSVLIDNCKIEQDTGSGIDLACDGGHPTVDIDQTALVDVALDGIRSFADGNGKAVTVYRSDMNAGHFSCHNVGPNNDGAAVFFNPDASGTVDKVSHNNTSGLGTTNNVTVTTNDAGGSQISPNIVAEADTGPR